MSKFLGLIEENTPDLNLDEKIAAKRAVQRCLMEKDIRCDADQKSDNIIIHLPDGRAVNLEVVDFVNTEDQELQVDDERVAEAGKVLKAAEQITGISDPRRRLTGIGNPKKNVEKSVGDLYNKVAKKVKEFAKQF